MRRALALVLAGALAVIGLGLAGRWLAAADSFAILRPYAGGAALLCGLGLGGWRGWLGGAVGAAAAAALVVALKGGPAGDFVLYS